MNRRSNCGELTPNVSQNSQKSYSNEMTITSSWEINSFPGQPNAPRFGSNAPLELRELSFLKFDLRAEKL